MRIRVTEVFSPMGYNFGEYISKGGLNWGFWEKEAICNSRDDKGFAFDH